eukprot:scaffold7987_cov200-Cylindrotheca_fusiformis.AAC.10
MPSQISPKLNPVAVRERSLSIPGCREIVSMEPNVVSFLVGLDQQDPNNLARVNIFVNTGTIATSRILNGQVRQTFRRNVSSLDVVARLLKHPESLIAIDDSLIGVEDDVPKPPASPRTLQKDIEFSEVGYCILQAEKEKLEKHLQAIEELNQPPLTSKTRKNKENYSQNGNDDDYSDSDSTAQEETEFQFSLPDDVMTQVDQCLRDIQRKKKVVKGVATNGKGTVFLYGNGGVAYTPSIPKALYQKLKQLRNSGFSARPSYIAVGTRERFYVAFNDGTAEWKGSKALDKILKKCVKEKKSPLSVAFGGSYDTFFVVFSDGSWQYEGRGIPETLEDILEERDYRADLVTVNLGPNGEWFLKAKNGRMWWNGVSDSLDKEIAHILKSGRHLNAIDFGESGSYFMSLNE